MNSPAELMDLLEKATKGSRALDAEIAMFIGGEAEMQKRGWRYRRPQDHRWYSRHWEALPYWSTNLSDAVDLVEERLPGRGLDLLREAIDTLQARGWQTDQPIIPQLCLALLKALVTALDAVDE